MWVRKNCAGRAVSRRTCFSVLTMGRGSARPAVGRLLEIDRIGGGGGGGLLRLLPLLPLPQLSGGRESPPIVLLFEMKPGSGALSSDLVGSRIRDALRRLGPGSGRRGATRDKRGADEKNAQQRLGRSHTPWRGKIPATFSEGSSCDR